MTKCYCFGRAIVATTYDFISSLFSWFNGRRENVQFIKIYMLVLLVYLAFVYGIWTVHTSSSRSVYGINRWKVPLRLGHRYEEVLLPFNILRILSNLLQFSCCPEVVISIFSFQSIPLYARESCKKTTVLWRRSFLPDLWCPFINLLITSSSITGLRD